MRLSQLDRFMQYVYPLGGLFDCIEWRGWKQIDGYGRFRTGGRGSPCIQAHRYYFEQHHGRKIKRGMELDHTCEYRSCISPYHCVEVTPQKNKHLRYGKRHQVELVEYPDYDPFLEEG